ncbi:MAG TPA: tRNA pseudouridine(13) synthase TruD [Wenzhouxiangella sp.]|nr:tRNA pseudouridine(13) synthase TruD [Wenzhouxiangella sp.]
MSDDDIRSAGFAWGGPAATGRIRLAPEDFTVEEVLGHEPDGQGEHLWLWIAKRERNTVDVAADLARAAGVSVRQVGFAGLKDRNAVTRQYFSIHLPGTELPDWSQWAIQGVVIESVVRSSRKIKRGRLRGNRFALQVRARPPPAGRRHSTLAIGVRGLDLECGDAMSPWPDWHRLEPGRQRYPAPGRS